MLLAGVGAFALTNAHAVTDAGAPVQRAAEQPPGERAPVAPPANGSTVYTRQQVGHGSIQVVGPSGRLRYYDDAHDGYWDVDEVAPGVVVYTATDRVDRPGCARTCIRQVIERLDLATGETTVLFSRLGPRYHAAEWHDADPVRRHSFLVADMAEDRVVQVNASTGATEWVWRAESAFPPESGGPYPGDWTHLNDVAVVNGTTVMASLRNQDRVVFVRRSGDVVAGRTLGGDHAVLYEQHNPDYLPADRGGPAVLVADSGNDRVVEYAWTGDGWTRTWAWRDDRLSWPRDADRLPDGNTLVTDTHGGRILEVAPDGDVVWSMDVASAYEAERLSTPPESGGGAAAARTGLRSVGADGDGSAGGASASGDASASGRAGASGDGQSALSVVPPRVRHGALAVAPRWMSFADVVLLAGLAGVAACWAGAEAWWAGYRVSVTVERRGG